MKNLLACMLLFSFYLSGNSYSLANGSTELMVVQDKMTNGGHEVMVLQGKKANTVYAFELPKEYTTDDTIEVRLLDSINTMVFSKTTSHLDVFLPRNLSGTYLLVINVKGYMLTKKITL